MTKGKYDLSGVVTAVAIKSANGASASVLVAADASKLSDSGAATGVTPMRYVVTVTNTSGAWAAAQVDTLTSR
jgi:tagatose-1,6-bisphosphate aldolase non-catalytic subunit AgaZ/GatZ